MFKLNMCKDKGAFSAKLENPRQMDFGKIRKSFHVVVDTPHVLVVERDGVEVIVHRHGELLFKNCVDIGVMSDIAKGVYENA